MASGGLEICVSSNSFQKNDIGWPQQPPTEKELKFNTIFLLREQKISVNHLKEVKDIVDMFVGSEMILHKFY